MSKTDNIFDKITSNGNREMTRDRFHQAIDLYNDMKEMHDDPHPLTEWEDMGISETEYWKQNYLNLKRQCSKLLDNALKALKDNH